jgi:hypothetical protein
VTTEPLKIGHQHCPKCGACFIAGVTQQIHRCKAELDQSIVRFMELEAQGPAARARQVHKTEAKRELKQKYGFDSGR